MEFKQCRDNEEHQCLLQVHALPCWEQRLLTRPHAVWWRIQVRHFPGHAVPSPDYAMFVLSNNYTMQVKRRNRHLRSLVLVQHTCKARSHVLNTDIMVITKSNGSTGSIDILISFLTQLCRGRGLWPNRENRLLSKHTCDYLFLL